MDGNHLSLINGEVEIYFNNDKTMFGRRLNAKAKYNTNVINEQDSEHEITMQAGKVIRLSETETTEEETQEEETTTEAEEPKPTEASITVGDEKRVCVGGSCASVSLWELWKLVLPDSEFTILEGDYEKPRGGAVVSKGLLYINEQEVNNFLESLPKGLSQRQFTDRLSESNIVNMESRIQLYRKIAKGQVDSKIIEMIEPAGFSNNQFQTIINFKDKVLAGKKTIPLGTKITLGTKLKSGKIVGTFTITFPREESQPLEISEGDKVRTTVLQKIGKKGEEYTSEFLYDRYQGNTEKWNKYNP